jgi:hypothetical protein
VTLSFTLLIESALALAFAVWHRKPDGALWLTCLAANLFTQSLLWLALALFFHHYWPTLLIMEIIIWLVEGLIFYSIPANRFTLREAFLLSLVSNLTSFVAGLWGAG